MKIDVVRLICFLILLPPKQKKNGASYAPCGTASLHHRNVLFGYLVLKNNFIIKSKGVSDNVQSDQFRQNELCRQASAKRLFALWETALDIGLEADAVAAGTLGLIHGAVDALEEGVIGVFFVPYRGADAAGDG